MTSFQLKIIAIITMLIDHIGSVLFPEIIAFRIIGRLAFPLFAFLLTEGYIHTSNLKKYIFRLAIFSLISQYPFMLAFGFDAGLNIFFTLTIGLTAIYLSDHYQSYLPFFILAILADLIHTDYGMFGVLLIFLIYQYKSNFKKMMIYIIALYSIFYLIGGLSAGIGAIHYYIQFFALLSFILIAYYSGREGRKAKYLFYIFYPGHLLILSFFS